MIRLSLIIPVYNVEKYIDKCLKSIFNQDVSSEIYEVIVVNDGTPDNSMNIVEQYAIQYSNIIIVNQENKGLSGARNTGLNHAKGEYVWFIDSDDALVDDSIKLLIEFLNRVDSNIISTDLRTVSEETGDLALEKTSIRGDHINELISGEKYLTSDMHIGIVQRFIFKRSFLNHYTLTFYQGIYHEDIEFMPRALFLANQIYISDLVLYRYLLRNEGSITASYKIKRSYDYIVIASSLEKFMFDRNTKVLVSQYIYCILNSFYLLGKHYSLNHPEAKEFIEANKEHFKSALSYAVRYKKKKILETFILTVSPSLLLILKNVIK